ncbi:MAG TPA: LuxR C-terminal-related transcriptional regulator [Ktedonobacteraceae bacterium]|nr:LuxR C-terminal-related transcriptional regulator [Ktedonobacteraceae bacterium]
MAQATPSVQQDVLNTRENALTITLETPEWFAWLGKHSVFRYISPAGTFTARRERRAAGWYWYAYRRQRGQLRNVYLGKAEELSLTHLNKAAATLSALFAREKRVVSMNMHHFLLTTKMVRPPLHTSLVPRPRLTAYLQAHAACKLVLVMGPAGCGKTTLVSDWLRKDSVAWISLDEEDNDLERFWSYVLAALQRSHPGLAAHVQTLLPALQTGTIEPLLVPLINALATLNGEVVLVLDDYHVLTNQTVHESLAFFLEHAPEQVHLVIASRRPPPLPLPRLLARGQLAEVHAADLRFHRHEAEALLTLLLDHPIDPEELTRLVEATEGWVTGLSLAALARRQGLAPLSGLHADQRELFAYLASEVLAYQPEPIREFLLRSSILQRLHRDLCDAVLLQQSSQDLLQHLERENLFLSPLDETGTWYRYHALFAAFLRARLEEVYPGQAACLHRRAAIWYMQNNLPAEAIDHALQADDFSLAAHLLEEQGRNALMRDEIMTLRSWLRAFPEDVLCIHPRLCILAAWVQLHTSRLEPIEHFLCAAEHALEQQQVAEEESQALVGEIAAIRARVAIYHGDIARSVTLAHHALYALARNDYYLRGEVMLSMGHAYEVLGKTDAAEATYCQAGELHWACGNLRAALLTVRSLALLLVGQGKLYRAHKLYQDNLERMREMGQEHLPPVGFLHVGLGELSYEWNDLEAAEHHLREGIALGQRGGDVKVWLLGYFWLIFTVQARGETARAWSLFAEAEHLARQANFTRGIAWLREIRLRLSVLQGNDEPLLTWAQECALDPSAEPDLRQEDEYRQLAQAFIIRQEPAHALGILRCLLHRAQQAQRSGAQIPLLLGMACAYTLCEKTDQAYEAVSQALTLAAPQGYLRTFLDEGAPVAALLGKLQQAFRQGSPLVPRSHSGYLRQLLQAAASERVEREQGGKGTALIEPLSQREVEVLRLLGAGHSNAEMAEMLVIGPNTIKTHLKNIYGKLGVSTRTQAIARARNLQVL